MLIYVCEWAEGLVGCDDPTALISKLEAGDVMRHPELMEDAYAAYKIHNQRNELSAKAAAEHRHTFRYNRHQLMKAWSPLRNSPTLTR
jgi:hypothetical protein